MIIGEVTIDWLTADLLVKAVTACAAVIGIVTSLLAISKTARLRSAVDKDLAILERLGAQRVRAAPLSGSIEFRLAEVAARVKYPTPVAFHLLILGWSVGAAASAVLTEWDEVPRASLFYTGGGILIVSVFFVLVTESGQRVLRARYLSRKRRYRRHADDISWSAVRMLTAAGLILIAFAFYIPISRSRVDLHDDFSGSVWRELAFIALWIVPMTVFMAGPWRRATALISWRGRLSLAKTKLKVGRLQLHILERRFALSEPGSDLRTELYVLALDRSLKLRRARGYYRELKREPLAKCPPGWDDWPTLHKAPGWRTRARRRIVASNDSYWAQIEPNAVNMRSAYEGLRW